MIEFNAKTTKIRLDFSFFAVLAFCFFLDKNNIMLMSFAACIIHEIGHLIVLLFFDIEIRTLCFYGAGIKLGCDLERVRFKRRLAVLLAGSTTNIVTCAFSVLFGSYSFAAVNLVIGVFNLLSIGNFDGRQIVSAVSERYCLPDVWLRLSNIISCLIVIAMSLFCGDSIGITFYLTLIYMLMIR